MAPILRTKNYLKILTKKTAKNQHLPKKKNVRSKNKGNSEVQKRRLEKKRIAEKLRRQKIRNEPEAYENYCQKKRARNEKKKIEGKRKSIEQLSDRE